MTNFALEDWLDIATRDLCADARARVCEEVKAHFAAAYDALIASGESADVAASGALASLGSAKKARRKYRQTYITKGEQKYLESLADTKTPLLAFATVLPIGFYIFFQSYLFGSTAVVIHGMVFFALYLIATAVSVWARTHMQNDLKRNLRLLAIGMAFYLIPLSMFGTFFVHVTAQPPMNGTMIMEWTGAFIGAVVLGLCATVIFFRNKLMRLHRKLVALDDQGPLGKSGEK